MEAVPFQYSLFSCIFALLRAEYLLHVRRTRKVPVVTSVFGLGMMNEHISRLSACPSSPCPVVELQAMAQHRPSIIQIHSDVVSVPPLYRLHRQCRSLQRPELQRIMVGSENIIPCKVARFVVYQSLLVNPAPRVCTSHVYQAWHLIIWSI